MVDATDRIDIDYGNRHSADGDVQQMSTNGCGNRRRNSRNHNRIHHRSVTQSKTHLLLTNANPHPNTETPTKYRQNLLQKLTVSDRRSSNLVSNHVVGHPNHRFNVVIQSFFQSLVTLQHTIKNTIVRNK